jgi:hypothetical protein
MTTGITWYDVLGVTAGASADTVRTAYTERVRQLAPELFSGAPSPVVSAGTRARNSIEAAWLVLGDRERRQRYDAAIGLHRGRGLNRSGGFGTGPSAYGPDPDERLGLPDGILDAGLAAAAAAWLAPGSVPPRRRRPVPDVRGLFFQPCLAVLSTAGLKVATVRLTPDPRPVEGLVVAQSPGPGSQAGYQSTVTVRIWHPPRRG